MTRESKLALIIGFVLVLVVGVLVSDHFSQASKMSLEIMPQSVQNEPIAELGPREEAAIERAIDRSPPRVALSTPAQTTTNMSQPQESGYEPVVIDNAPKSSLIEQAFEEARRIASETELPVAAQTSRTKKTQPEPQRTLPEKTYQIYTVQSGDSLIAIARRLLGNPDRYEEIKRLNADILDGGENIQIGMRLKLPGDARVLTSSTSSRSSGQTRSSGDRTYTVQSGDSLGMISQRLLGTSKRMDEIVELNNLADADQIYVGMTLKIPSR